MTQTDQPHTPAASLPRIAVTMGDPAGVGPEICLRILADAAVRAICSPVILGDATVLDRCAAHVGLPRASEVLSWEAWKALAPQAPRPQVVDLRQIAADQVVPGVFTARTGLASIHYVESAIQAALSGQVSAVTTGPIHKEAIHAAGIPFPGHTEIFAERTRAKSSCMMQYSEEITCTFVTTHIGYAQVPRELTTERILEVIHLTVAALRRIRRREPRLLVCGLNPHAGEHGLFGNQEEERVIAPAVAAAREAGIQVAGPIPPDTAFIPANRRAADAVVCMYHDQGHIPVKALAFDAAVNTTLGLPIVRTSVDHGTAGDIAWQGKANPGSMLAALRLASRLATDCP